MTIATFSRKPARLHKSTAAFVLASIVSMPVATLGCDCALGQALNNSDIGPDNDAQPSSGAFGALLDPAEPAPPVTSDPDACAKLNSWSLRPTWNIPYLATSETLYPDCNGVRGKLADFGIGLGLQNIENGNINFLSIGKPTPQGQQYVGQIPTAFTLTVNYLTFDLDKLLGIPNAKVVAGAKLMEPTWATIGPSYFEINSLYYDQRMFEDHLELQLGYIENDFEYIGTYVGGRLAGGTLGPEAVIPFEVGLSNNVSTAPTANLRASLGNFYEKVGVQRSIPPGVGNVPDVALNPTGFDFTIPGTKPLVIDEVGYQVHPAEDASGIWLRGGGIYNFTQYPGFGTAPASTNYALYGLADFQLLQTFRPESGIFAGGSIMYAPPDVNIYSQYCELRLYDIGPFPQRPYDFASLVATRTIFGQNAIDYFGTIGVPTHEASTSVTASYTYRVIKGLWLGAALTYTRNPAFRVQPGDPNAFNGTLALTLWE